MNGIDRRDMESRHSKKIKVRFRIASVDFSLKLIINIRKARIYDTTNDVEKLVRYKTEQFEIQLQE